MQIVNLQWEDTIPIRHKVLWPDKDPLFCKVEGDESALHYGVVISNHIVCVASVYIDGSETRLRKFATLKEFQNLGIGSKLLKHIVNDISKFNVNYFWLDARETAISFYEKYGFLPEGERFFKNDVAYFKVSKHL